jgi:hypothetical protein
MIGLPTQTTQSGQSLEPLSSDLQVGARSWTSVADLVHASGPVLCVAQLALPARVIGATSANGEAGAHPSGRPCAMEGPDKTLRLAFSGATSGDIAVWDLSGERPVRGDSAMPVSPGLHDQIPLAMASTPYPARTTRRTCMHVLLVASALWNSRQGWTLEIAVGPVGHDPGSLGLSSNLSA